MLLLTKKFVFLNNEIFNGDALAWKQTTSKLLKTMSTWK